MKKLIIAILILFPFLSACSGKRVFEPVINTNTIVPTHALTATCTPPALSSQTRTATPSASAQTPGATATPPAFNSPTEFVTPTVTPVLSATPAPTATITPTSAATCFIIPRLGEFGDDRQPKYYAFITGNTITARTFSFENGVYFNYGIYDGASSLIDSGSITSGTDGYYDKPYYIKGTESTASKWLFILLPFGVAPPSYFIPGTDIFSGTEIYDNDRFYVLSVVPTPTSTPPCMDMPIICADFGYKIQKYRYKLNRCATVYYVNRWPSVYTVNAAWYDGADNLVKVEYGATFHSYPYPAASGVTSSYGFNGTESCGTWHVVLFNTTDTPPSTYTTGLPGCGQSYFTVEPVNSPVSFP